MPDESLSSDELTNYQSPAHCMANLFFEKFSGELIFTYKNGHIVKIINSNKK